MQRPHTENIHHYLPGLSLSFWLLGDQVQIVASSGTQKQVVGFAKATSSSLAHNQHLEPLKFGFALVGFKSLTPPSYINNVRAWWLKCVSWRDWSRFLASSWHWKTHFGVIKKRSIEKWWWRWYKVLIIFLEQLNLIFNNCWQSSKLHLHSDLK